MVYSTRRFVLCLTLCHFVLVFFNPFSIAITSLGEERANLSALFCACLDLSVSSSSWCLGRAVVCDCVTSWTLLLPFFSHVLWLKVHSLELLRVCLLGSKRKLPPLACQVRLGLPSVVCHPRGVQFSGTVYICNQVPLSNALSPLHFLCTQCLQPLQKMLLLPTPVRQTAHGNSPEFCKRSRRVPQSMIFVFPAFTLSPFSSIAS